jgi:hypothetical protein
MTIETDKLLIIQPLGPQGPKVGVGVSSREDVEKLDTEINKIPENKRRTVEGLTKAVKNAELPLIKP